MGTTKYPISHQCERWGYHTVSEIIATAEKLWPSIKLDEIEVHGSTTAECFGNPFISIEPVEAYWERMKPVIQRTV